MADPAPFSNLATPEEIARKRKIADAMLAQGMDASPVGHWTQALARVVQGGTAGWQNAQANQDQKDRTTATMEALNGSGVMGALDPNTRALIGQDPKLMQSVLASSVNRRLDPNAGINSDILKQKLQLMKAQTSKAMSGGEAPSNVREWRYFNGLSPEDQQRYLVMKRAEKYLDVGTGFVRPNPVDPMNPVGTIKKDIAGREAAEEVGKAQGKFQVGIPKAQAKFSSLSDQKELLNDEIDQALKLIGPTTTGGAGAVLRNVPYTNALKLKERIATLKGNIGFDRLQQMRDESPTGGALGQVAVQELMALQGIFGALEQAEDGTQLAYNMKRLRRILDTRSDRYKRAYEVDLKRFGTGSLSPEDAALPSEADRQSILPQPKRRKWNSATGRLE